jgi:putative RecB family exonuclease
MSLPVPARLSPSRVEAFLSCPLAFRFSAVERLPEPPSPHAVKGNLVHRALELLFARAAPARTHEAARLDLARAVEELRSGSEWPLLGLEPAAAEVFLADAAAMVDRYFAMEDPRQVHAIGVELRLEVQALGVTLHGVIDRLDLEDGELVVTDYKTGRPPGVAYERQKLNGVHFYAYLCQALFGKRPARVQLYFLGTGEILSTVPSEQSAAFLPKRARAVWDAVERACANESFLPKPGGLCGSCSFQRWCPAFGGNPSLAAVEAPRRLLSAAAA